ncbi:MAG: thiamine diphosphokinase [Balneolaceae bacterium]|nr:thiamine diphosphokinase [Balneolaceae bacterium]
MDILILCNGLAPSKELLKETCDWADFFIAADGGANTALSMGIKPDVVIGDMDSYSPSLEDDFKIIEDPDQYSNDLEKALGLAADKKAQNIMVLGAIGKRVDQTLKNISVLKQFNKQFKNLIFRDDYGDLKLIESPFSADLEVGTTVSLFPLSGKVTGIKTEGLMYPLNNETLENGVKDGSSNEVVSNPVSISFEKGDLILFVGRNI